MPFDSSTTFGGSEVVGAGAGVGEGAGTGAGAGAGAIQKNTRRTFTKAQPCDLGFIHNK